MCHKSFWADFGVVYVSIASRYVEIICRRAVACCRRGIPSACRGLIWKRLSR